MRRVGLVALLTAAALVLPVAAFADDSVEEYLERAAAADFHGRGVLVCSWDGQSAGSVYEVTRTHGMTMVTGSGRDVMLGGGVAAMRDGADWHGLEVGAAAEWRVADRYTISAGSATARLGRPATETTILEGGAPRARIVVDDESGAVVLAEVLDGEGRVFRIAALLDLDVTPSMPAGMDPESMPEMEMMEPVAAPVSLPADAAGYRRADVYAGPGGGGVQAFYSDGLFSFSVFEFDRGGAPDAFRTAGRWETAGERYRRIVTPSNVWVQWDAPDRSYVLVGDLPPDHLVSVLGAFPEPGDRGLLVRWWRRLFG